MSVDVELQSWQREWQAVAAVPADLQHRVRRQVRSARIGLLGSILVTMWFGIGLPVWAVVSQRADVVVLAGGVWLALVLAWIATLTLSRGTWRPAGQTTTAFLEFSILSCRRNRQAIAAAAVLYVMLLAFVKTWVYYELSRQTPLDPWTYLTMDFNIVVWLITIALGLLALWRRRVLQHELDNLMQLRRDYGTM
jgi:hypothetical protein